MFERDRIVHDTFVSGIAYRHQVGSTNDLALALAADGEFAHPWLVLAARQTAGRGRGAHHWWSGEGALTFSLILDARAAELPEGRRTLVSLAAGLAACRALAARLPDRAFGLKWPNDVYLESRKVCGILVEVPAKRPGVMVLGVGINVNNTLAEAPDELRGKATSLFDATGIRHDLTDVLIDVLERLAGELEILSRDPDSLARRWNEHCLLHARTVCLEVGSRQVEGRCRGIDGSGAIILETGAGIELFHSGVVTGFE